MSEKIFPSAMDSKTLNVRDEILDSLLNSPIARNELIRQLGVYLLPMELKRFLFFDSLYRQLINVPGVIVEFGCRWGQNLATLQNLRSIYEPYNYRRHILGFDTFSGLKGVGEQDGAHEIANDGTYGVTAGYESHLERLLLLKESQSPISEMKKFELIKGDAVETFSKYITEHRETLIAFAYFDMDIYKPTVECLKLLKPHLTKGSIVGFDELNFPAFPGETIAFQEAIGSNNIWLKRNAYCHMESFFVFE
jgi:hypothetical protein